MVDPLRRPAGILVRAILRLPREVDRRIAQGCIANARVAALDSRRRMAMRKLLEAETQRLRAPA